ncbi:hypothetical protein J6R97_05355 [bacterium]|nr:hypothetical protein [bacterium]
MKISSIRGYYANNNYKVKNNKMNNQSSKQDTISFGKKNKALLLTLAGILAILPFPLLYLKQKKQAEANE